MAGKEHDQVTIPADDVSPPVCQPLSPAVDRAG